MASFRFAIPKRAFSLEPERRVRELLLRKPAHADSIRQKPDFVRPDRNGI
jgi:hypothetical protein